MTPVERGFLDFGGRTVVVTGASQGIGRACAEELSAHGARVVLIGRDAAKLESARAALAGEGHQIVPLDLTYFDQIAPCIARVFADSGRLYGLCHAAGRVATEPLGATTIDVIEQMMAVNVLAGLELARTISRRDVMEPAGGSFVFVSSIYGNVGVAGETGYSATKGAISAAARAMAMELARRRIRVNTISPGFVKTPMTMSALDTLSPDQAAAIERKHPLGIGAPVDVARAAVFLLAPATTWITGTDLVVDGGYSAQ
jgi:NAD(P)-dependent dehydrogenase (short-subunit alcohol dehydrogenase family)